MKHLAQFFVLFAICGSVPLTHADDSGSRAAGNVGPRTGIEQAGLKVEWFTQLDIAVTGSIIDSQLVVDENNSTTFFALEYGKQREIISQKMLNPFGKPFGIEGADEYAKIRQEVIQAHLDAEGKGVKVEINRYTLPETTIFTLTNTGLVSAVDADTGKVRWSTYVGSYDSNMIGLGADANHIAVANGCYIYCLKAENGKVMFKRLCEGIASTSPAVGAVDPTQENGKEGFIYVPLQRGLVQVFSIEKNGLSHEFQRGIGAATSRPLITEDSISWPTYKGHYNVIKRYPKNKGLAYRLKAYDPILSTAGHYNGTFYITSLDGFLYALDEETGSLKWDFSTGEGISQPAIPINDSVYVITNERDLFRLDYLTGIPSEGWDTPLPNIDHLVGKSKQHLYLVDTLGRLVTMDFKTKQKISVVDIGQTSFLVANDKTDRIYLGYGNGRLTCLREVGSEYPHFHSKEVVAEKVEKTEEKKEEAEKPLFEKGDDPFKAFDSKPTTPKSGASDDPFGSDPFKGTDDKKSSGAVDDPFGK